MVAAMVRAAGAGCAAAAAESPVELAQRLGAERAAAVQGLAEEQLARRAAEDRAAAAESRTSEVAEVRAVIFQGVVGDIHVHNVASSAIQSRHPGYAMPWCWQDARGGRCGARYAPVNVRLQPQPIALHLCRHGFLLSGERMRRVIKWRSRRTTRLGTRMTTAALPSIVRP